MRSFFILCIMALPFSIHAEDSLFHADHNLIFGVVSALPKYSNKTVRDIAKKLQMEPFVNENTGPMLVFRSIAKPRYFFGYLEDSYPLYRLKPLIKRELRKHDFTREDQTINLYGFRVWPGSTKSQLNVGRFLNSACMQETDQNYASDSTNFISLPPKDMHELRKRIWISTGYAAAYACKNNPFMSGGGSNVFEGYFAEGFFWAYVIGGPIFGRNLNEKLGYAALGALGVLEIKFLVGRDFKREVQIYNMFATGPYRIPKEIRF